MHAKTTPSSELSLGPLIRAPDFLPRTKCSFLVSKSSYNNIPNGLSNSIKGLVDFLRRRAESLVLPKGLATSLLLSRDPSEEQKQKEVQTHIHMQRDPSFDTAAWR